MSTPYDAIPEKRRKEYTQYAEQVSQEVYARVVADLGATAIPWEDADTPHSPAQEPHLEKTTEDASPVVDAAMAILAAEEERRAKQRIASGDRWMMQAMGTDDVHHARYLYSLMKAISQEERDALQARFDQNPDAFELNPYHYRILESVVEEENYLRNPYDDTDE